jgi:UDP-N-acetylglucosamine 2-epimerase (non-hydrolysing)
MTNGKKIKILNIVGARPNFMKIAPLFREYKKNKNINPILVHTNQHFDKKMSGVFLESLGIPKPNYTLDANNKSPISTISGIMSDLEPILHKEKPDLVLVVGDVNSTLAGALAANKAGIKVAHVESGLRSGDMNMPEEINRILVDNIADMLFATEKSAIENLKKESIEKSKIFFVGNVMIDNLINMLPKINKSNITKTLGLSRKQYILMTMHRPANVDSKEGLINLIKLIKNITQETGLKIIFPIHPRTLKNLENFDLMTSIENIDNLKITEPMDYINFIKLIKDSFFVLTDSGGIQEETAYLKIPTITLRDSTERPSTIECGSNTLCPLSNIKYASNNIISIIKKNQKPIKNIPLNDGKTSKRIVDTIIKQIKK